MPSRTQQVAYAVCASVFSFWFTIRVFEPLWPNAETRPLILPLCWLFLMSIALFFCLPSLMALIRSKRWLIAAAVALTAVSPVFSGYLALLIQQHLIGFILSE
jgi:hypothetical protein